MFIRLIFIVYLMTSQLEAQDNDASNLNDMRALFQVPSMTSGNPAPGKRIKLVTAGWESTQIHHALYLPKDWNPDRKWPVIVEYPGNGGYANKLGDVSEGTVEGCMMGYGLSEGKGFIWVSMPFVGKNGHIALQWWGDVEATKRYCMDTVRNVCSDFRGDPSRVILAGFSRGAIACNYIGLHDDTIASLWCGMICHSHYEAEFRHPAKDQAQWPQRLMRLGNRPQFITHEMSVQPIQDAIHATGFEGNLTFGILPFNNHSARWVMCDLKLRKDAIKWLSQFSDKASSN